jgi:8-oxo-dGTP diphosphatase
MSEQPVVVVGAAIVRSGRVLAARRSATSVVSGGWELPGGKVDPGETDEEALRREIREELGVDIQILDRVGEEQIIGPGRVLRAWLARIDGAVEPRALEDHDELRWLTADELDDVAWLPGDRPLVAAVAPLLRSSGGR